MKKNLIYAMAFLLIGTFSLSSCQDMLNVDSDRVEYDFDDWAPSDSVYSVLGILKAVQGVADRHIILNELRADLVIPSATKAVVDVQDICNSNFTNIDNKYLDAKDYYTIINNCNVFLNRVDTTLKKNGVSYMLPEYVAVKSVRAWTYLQLAINYNNIPYFTEPITTHDAAEDIMAAPKLSRDEVLDKLIADILPYENPEIYTMPAWYNDGKIVSFGYNNTKVETSKLFVPIRMLLGEMYLWKGDYKKAANCFYTQLAGNAASPSSPKYADNRYHAKYTAKNGKGMGDNYSKLFAFDKYSNNSSNYFTVIPFASNSLHGTTSELASVFSPQNDLGGAQVFASPGLVSLSSMQKYRYVEGDNLDKPTYYEYGDAYEYPGDLRLKATTYSQTANDVHKTEYKNIIAKFNLEIKDGGFSLNHTHVPGINTTLVVLQRAELAYLRLAEALVGLDKEGYEGAMELAMTILKEGVKHKYPIIQNPVTKERPKLTADGDTIKKLDENGDSVVVLEEYLYSYSDSIGYDFTHDTFKDNFGIHSRGTGGDAEHNPYFALDSLCIARYLGNVEKTDTTEIVLVPVTYQDSLNYMNDLILDELALELAWEGTRFGDLIRFAKAMDDKDVLAKRIAGRAETNTVTYRNVNFVCNPDLYNKMLSEENWYLPLPDEILQPATPSTEKK